ncbi:MAG: sensor histidine kinase [Acidimicrobiales bacterium]
MAVVGVSGAVYLLVRHDLVHRVDAALEHRAKGVSARWERHPGQLPNIPSNAALVPNIVQVLDSTGTVVASQGPRARLPFSPEVNQVAKGTRGRVLTSLTVEGIPVRLLAVPLGSGQVLELARPLDQVDQALSRLTFDLVAVSLVGVAGALGLGAAVAGSALRPVRRLSASAERITATRDLSHRLPELSHDELGRLSHSFNALLGAVESSQQAQRQLVADASHELRTPLTSLRTNLEVMGRADLLDPESRRELIADVVAQIDGLNNLVTDLVDLAREDEELPRSERVALHQVVAKAVERARRLHPGLAFSLTSEPTTVNGSADWLARAVDNLLDNAAKWSPPGGGVEVQLDQRELRVRDEGPGIDPGDLPRVFERFYRGHGARGTPGSGLGLAIVKRIAEAHGATVTAEGAPGGGTLFRMKF